MSVRDQVTRHGAGLLATATALGVTAGCTKPDPAKPDPVPTTATTASSTATASASATTSPLVSASATASATPSATATAAVRPTATPTHGYAVVDPMPMPARCRGSSASAKGSGTYVARGSETVLKITLKLGGGTTWTGGSPSPSSGALKSVSANAGKDTVEVFLEAKETGVSIPISCAAGKASIEVNVAPPSPAPKPGDVPTVNLYDGY